MTFEKFVSTDNRGTFALWRYIVRPSVFRHFSISPTSTASVPFLWCSRWGKDALLGDGRCVITCSIIQVNEVSLTTAACLGDQWVSGQLRSTYAVLMAGNYQRTARPRSFVQLTTSHKPANDTMQTAPLLLLLMMMMMMTTTTTGLITFIGDDVTGAVQVQCIVTSPQVTSFSLLCCRMEIGYYAFTACHNFVGPSCRRLRCNALNASPLSRPIVHLRSTSISR